MEEDSDVTKKIVISAILVLILGFAGWYLFSGASVSNNGNGADAVREQLSTAQDKQQSAIDELGDIENGLEDSANEAGRISDGLGDTSESISSVEERIDASQERLTNSAGLIEDSQRILEQVRERGQVGTN